ncbi:hypothetical protein [Robiginitalea aurantiaca]|uniref:Inhibitor of g-type lysozyme n=1 Tax=Robiginitalea aurantiaca TaxID=3056915 RepID=A0ABT7WGI9_9FLAO|nr:hypothetical protein [Robiginitalea aurantiaca]MDM9632039.1 hypothetical protein [Robiginitalea aurantiaca]
MKRNDYLIPMALLLAISLTSCKQDTKDKINQAQEAVVEETKEAAKTVGDAAEKAGEAVGEAAEKAGEAVGDAAEAVKDEIKKVRIQFDSGANSKTIESSISGRETVDYVLNGQEGQYMNISMATQHGATYFNVMEPGEAYVAIYNGSTSGNQFEGTAAKSGDYTIRVYMMRSAARRGETADYRLEMIVE